MKKKSILVCRKCMSRNYTYKLSSERTKSLTLKKYCSHCKQNMIHDENK